MFRPTSIFCACMLWLALYSESTYALEPLRAPADPFLVSPPGIKPDDNVPQTPKNLGELEFTLRHIYHRGSHDYPHLHRYVDIAPDAQMVVADEVTQTRLEAPKRLKARAVSTNIQRMVDRSRSTMEGILNHAEAFGQAVSLPASAWTIDQIAGPDVSNKSTIVSLAWMAANAYTEVPYTGDWHDVGSGFNSTDDFGWEGDGLRGHIFATEDNSTIVIGLKGTSMALFDGAETTGNDKTNDNLFGSCCCAQGGDFGWKHVCECMTDTLTCNSTCVGRELRRKSRYYQAAQDLFHNVTERYPNSEVWLAGHSLGGVVSTLLGLTYGLPVVTFEAYPDALAASRLGLPVPPGFRAGVHQARTDVAIHHFGNTADPIFVGQCHGFSSPCSIFGYAFESSCHTGKKCTYDTVNDKGWRVGIGNHRIFVVIPEVLEAYDTVANCTEGLDCTDCYKWKFFESNGTETTTTTARQSTSTYTRTRTETCKTPGWWGCLDESTTPASTTTTTMTSSTSTCKTPGWFGCNDPTTTTTSSTITKPAAGPVVSTVTTTTITTTSSTTCESPGWFGGCHDSTTTPPPSHAPSQSFPTPTTSQTSCTSSKWFGLVCDDPTTTSSTSAPSASHPPKSGRDKCVSRYWFGLCKEWRWEPENSKLDL